jgi:hypothetical protein
VLKCGNLLKPVLGDVNGSLHMTVPSMSRLNQTEPATFSILTCWAFFRDSVFLYFYSSIIRSGRVEIWQRSSRGPVCLVEIVYDSRIGLGDREEVGMLVGLSSRRTVACAFQ